MVNNIIYIIYIKYYSKVADNIQDYN